MAGEKVMSSTEHLLEFRRTLVTCAVAVAVTSGFAYFAFGGLLMDWISAPLADYDVKLVYLSLTEPFMTELKVSFLAGIILALPIIMWEIWRFVAPALTAQERKYAVVFITLSIALFLGGAAFGYLMVLKYAARFLIGAAGPELVPALSIEKYVSFLTSFLIPFGVIFELPMASAILSYLGVLSPKWMVKYRKYAILLIFVMSGLLTPTTDIITQTFMAGPMIVLYEVSIRVSHWMQAKRPRMLVDTTD